MLKKNSDLTVTWLNNDGQEHLNKDSFVTQETRKQIRLLHYKEKATNKTAAVT